MEYQKSSNILDNTTTQPYKFGTKNQFEISDVARGTYNTYSQINFKTVVLNSYLFDYNSAYILAKGIITITGAETNAIVRLADGGSKQIVFKNYDPCTDHISEMNNKQVYNAKYLDIVVPMHNLRE